MPIITNHHGTPFAAIDNAVNNNNNNYNGGGGGGGNNDGQLLLSSPSTFLLFRMGISFLYRPK